MVSKKKLGFGSNGYRPPIIPRAPRSIRRKGPLKKFPEETQLSAFELLASVAGKLLHESESSASSNIADGKMKIPLGINENEEGKTVKSESCAYGNGSCAESSLLPEGSVEDHSLPEVHENSEKADIKGVCEYKNVDGDNTKVEDSNGECENTNLHFNPDSSVKLPFYSDPISNILVQKRLNNVKLGIRDDDEKSFRCNKFSTKIRPFRPQSRVGHRRMRKTLTSKYWKIARKVKDYELYDTSEGMNSFYRYRKSVYARPPIKKRKLSDQTSSDSTVKFSIKSLRVPEIYVEVPETATVGSLKRSVLEAFSAIVGGGIRVGLVLQGKKVRDNKRTLQQVGICQNNNLENMGFTLESNFSPVSSSMTRKSCPLVVPCETGQESPRPPDTPMIESVISNVSTDAPLVDDYVNNDNLILSQEAPTNASNDEKASDSKALILAPPMNVEALAVTPLNSKNKCNELSQRRIRRPFSVAEVEALVESVEKLGTGRWRDVKMRAFENADHRTYVDLKDKWKTLVHTGSISPQQRRGEPVPQHLLDRVLSTHSYWSQHQSKQLEKHQVEPTKIVDAREEIVGS